MENRLIPALKKIVVFIFGMALFMSVGTGQAKEKPESTDLFTHKNTIIEADQTVGKLMVAGGNAVVDGKVTDGIVIIDGNLTIKSGARISGRIVVLGGGAFIEPGAKIESKAWVIAQQGHLMVPIVVGVLLLLGASSFILIPVLLWIIGYISKKSKWFLAVKKPFLLLEQRWPVIYIGVSLSVSAIMLAAFGALAWKTIFLKTTVIFDECLIWLIRYFATPAIDRTMIVITDLGFGTSFVIILTSTLLLLAFLKHWLELRALAVCLVGGAVLSLLLKSLFQRARPDFFRVVQEWGYSFPSGHALATMCFYGMTAFIVMRKIKSWRGRLAVMTLAVILSIAIGVSRIYLGVHYPTDVVAGYAAGSMWLAFCISLLMWWEQKREKEIASTGKDEVDG